MKNRDFIFGAAGVIAALLLAATFRSIHPPHEVNAMKGTPVQPLQPSEPLAPNAQLQTPAPTDYSAADVRWGPNRDAIRLTPEQAEAYVSANHRNVMSLLAASRASGEKAYLREAMQRFPHDPRVAFDAFFMSVPYEKQEPATPERRQWLDALQSADPENALPDYLAARDDFKAGRTEQAVKELQAAAGKDKYDVYVLDSLQATEEAYRSAGYSELDCKASAIWGVPLPHLFDMRADSGRTSQTWLPNIKTRATRLPSKTWWKSAWAWARKRPGNSR